MSGERVVTLAALIAILALAWGWLLVDGGMSMGALEMTAMAGMDGWLMQPAVWTPSYAVVVFSMWWIMMVAMMLPSAVPMLLLFGRVSRNGAPPATVAASSALFAIGYLLAWGAFSAVATVLQWRLESARVLSPMLEVTNAWLGAGILLLAGFWQLMPIKSACLRQCRSPLSFLINKWQGGPWGAFRMGLQHGIYCLGCCWFLMALLFFGGIMNLYWITGIAVFVLMEKWAPYGERVGRLAGMVLVAGAVLLVLQA